VSTPDALPVTADDGWRRLHPLTPLVRSWKVLAVLLAIVAQQRGPEIASNGLPSQREALYGLAGLGVAVVVAGVYGLLSWQRSQYRVDGDSLQLHTGVLFRQQRRARLDRLQAVDVVRPLLARLFGLAELRLEVAGGKNSAIKLSLLREDHAQALRNTLLARAAGLAYEGEVAPEAPEREVLAVPVGRTIEALARSGTTIAALLALAALVVVVVITSEPAVLSGFVPIVIGAVTATWGRFQSAFGFRVATSPDGVRLHHGLLTTRAQTVPPGRVQAVRLTQPLLWRGRDWWSLRVNVAGYGGGGDRNQQSEQGQETVLLTVGTRAEALHVLSLALPAAAAAQRSGPLGEAFAAGLTGTSSDHGYVVAPRSSRWLDPIGWRRHGVHVDSDLLLLRRGVLVRQLDVVPHARTQSLGVEQGPLQRMLSVATFVVHSTAGPVKPTIEHLPCAIAGDLLDQQAERARLARVGADDRDHGRWMHQPPA
jgi:putative membrane protein